MNRAAIPGLAEAVQQEAHRRVASFTPETKRVAGVNLLPLTPGKLAVLESIGCPVVAGVEFPEPEDVAIFLWFLCEDFKVDAKAQAKFIKRICAVDYFVALTECQTWFKEQFADCPSAPKNDTRNSYVSWIASLVDCVASEYGWSEEQILEVPLVRLMQYVRAIQMRHDPSRPMFNPSDKIKGDYLAQQKN